MNDSDHDRQLQHTHTPCPATSNLPILLPNKAYQRGLPFRVLLPVMIVCSHHEESRISASETLLRLVAIHRRRLYARDKLVASRIDGSFGVVPFCNGVVPTGGYITAMLLFKVSRPVLRVMGCLDKVLVESSLDDSILMSTLTNTLDDVYIAAHSPETL